MEKDVDGQRREEDGWKSGMNSKRARMPVTRTHRRQEIRRPAVSDTMRAKRQYNGPLYPYGFIDHKMHLQHSKRKKKGDFNKRKNYKNN